MYAKEKDDDVAAQTLQLFSQLSSLKSIEFQKIPFYNPVIK